MPCPLLGSGNSAENEAGMVFAFPRLCSNEGETELISKQIYTLIFKGTNDASSDVFWEKQSYRNYDLTATWTGS